MRILDNFLKEEAYLIQSVMQGENKEILIKKLSKLEVEEGTFMAEELEEIRDGAIQKISQLTNMEVKELFKTLQNEDVL